MMESAHSPGDALTPNDEDPFKSVSSSNLDDLALDDDEIDETDGVGDAYKQIHVAPLTDDDLDTLSHDIPPSSTSALPSEPIHNPPSIQDEEDPWAVLAAAAGNTTSRGASVSASAATVPSSNLTSRDAIASERPDPSSPTTVTYSHAQGENFSIDTAAPVSSNNDRDRPPHPRLPAELATLSKHIQTSAAHLGDVLSTTLRDVDEKNELSAKVLPRVKSNFETTTKSIDEKIHVSETWEGFKTRVWKPTAEKVAPKVKDRWGVVSQSVVGWKEKMGRGPASDAEGSAGEGDGGRHLDDLERYARGDEEFSNAEASLADESAPAAASSPSPPSGNTHAAPTPFMHSIGQLGQKAQQLKWNEKWASISSTVGNKWQSAAAELEQWKEEQKKKMDSEHSEGNAGPFDPNGNDGGYDSHSDPVSAKVRESLKGGMGWVSKRFKEVKFQKEQGASDYHGPRPGTEMQDMSMDRETKRLDSDGLPSSFFKE